MGVPEVVEADAAHPGPLSRLSELVGDDVRVERAAVRPTEDEVEVLPVVGTPGQPGLDLRPPVGAERRHGARVDEHRSQIGAPPNWPGLVSVALSCLPSASNGWTCARRVASPPAEALGSPLSPVPAASSDRWGPRLGSWGDTAPRRPVSRSPVIDRPAERMYDPSRNAETGGER